MGYFTTPGAKTLGVFQEKEHGHRQISNGKGAARKKDIQNAAWKHVVAGNHKKAFDAAIRELNTGFENLIQAAKTRNWEQVKSCYEILSNLIEG